MEERPERRRTLPTSNPYIHLQTTALATQARGIRQHMVKYIKPSFGCYLPSLETGQGTSGLENPPWQFGAPSKCHLSGEENKMPGWGEDPQHTSKHWCPNPSSIWHPSSLSPSSRGRQIPRERWQSGWPWGRELGPSCVWGSSGSPHAAPPRTRGKKFRRQRRKASAAKWLIGFYGNWLRSTPAAYPTVPLSPYF